MKHKAQTILFVLCVLFTKHKAQTTYFNHRYDNFNNGDGASAFDTLFNNYYTIGFAFNPPNYGFSWGLNLKKYDTGNGLEQKTKSYFINSNNFAPQLNRPILLNNQILVGGERVYSSYKSWVFMWRFSSDIDSLSYKEYGFINKTNSCWATIKTKDNKIYLVGYTDSSQTNSDILIIKTDTAGNEIWKKKIGSSTWDESTISIDTIQGQLIIGGNKLPHSNSNTQGFVMRLDTAGNVLWQKTVVTNGGFGGCVAKTLKDGNILVYSRYKMYSIGSNDYYRLQVEKITPNNVSLWSNKYNAPAISANPYSAIENKHGNIVIVGQACYLPGIAVNGVVNEIAQNGDSLLHKEFYYQQGCQNYFRDVIQAPDGGYCFAGFFTPVFANGCTGTQDIWLLKVDSNFCESAVPCGADVGVSDAEALEASERGVRVYPNPATDFLEISFLNDEPVTIEITNTLGQVLYTKRISQTELGKNNNTIKLSPLGELEGAGLYYLTIKSNQSNSSSPLGRLGGALTTKFIKQ